MGKQSVVDKGNGQSVGESLARGMVRGQSQEMELCKPGLYEVDLLGKRRGGRAMGVSEILSSYPNRVKP